MAQAPVRGRPQLEHTMQITRSSLATVVAPAEWSTGSVYLDVIAQPSAGSRVFAVNVHFAPAARPAWHTHPNGQTIHITEGVGLVQRRGGPVEVVHPGDRIFFDPGEEHWHGAAPDRFMAHVAVLESDTDGNNATWLERVTDEEYGVQPG
jgi:quercetin dioxygenase-like cupin family protein